MLIISVFLGNHKRGDNFILSGDLAFWYPVAWPGQKHRNINRKSEVVAEPPGGYESKTAIVNSLFSTDTRPIMSNIVLSESSRFPL